MGQFPIDFAEIKNKTSILNEVLLHIPASAVSQRNNKKYMCCCWHHTEDTPSLMINTNSNTYHCFACGFTGTVIDIRCHFAGLNPKSGVDVFRAIEMILSDHEGKAVQLSEKAFNQTAPRAVEVKKHYFNPEQADIFGAFNRLVRSEGEAKRFALQRGWIETNNPYPLGLGKSFGPAKNESALEFPKLIQTEQTAEAFGLEEKFRSQGTFLVDMKKRLTPNAEKVWQTAISAGKTQIKSAPRWTAIPHYHDWLPWEFDDRDCGREISRTLLITEGPGDGLRVENELIRAGVENDYHVCAIDSASSLKTQNFVNIVKNNNVRSFFSGWDNVVFLLDNDRAGLAVRESAVSLLEELKPMGTVSFLPAPRISESVKDISDYFDAGGSVAELNHAIRKSETLMFR